MPLHGTHEQMIASYYFDCDEIKKINYHFPDSILEYDELIEETKASIRFMDTINVELEDSNYSWKEYIIYEIHNAYEKESDEMALLEASEYYIFYMDGYYIQTELGNYRNWIYAVEIDDEYLRLTKYLKDLESKLLDKIVLIGLEIARLSEI